MRSAHITSLLSCSPVERETHARSACPARTGSGAAVLPLSRSFARWCGGGIVRQRFANQVAGETTNHNVLTQLCDLGAHEFLDRLVGIFDKTLFQQTNRAVKFLQLAVTILFTDRFRFALSLAPCKFRARLQSDSPGTSSRLT